jgi:hypothetical protein
LDSAFVGGLKGAGSHVHALAILSYSVHVESRARLLFVEHFVAGFSGVRVAHERTEIGRRQLCL